MLLKHQVAKELESAFSAEGNAFVWKNLMAESLLTSNYAKQPDYDPGEKIFIYCEKGPMKQLQLTDGKILLRPAEMKDAKTDVCCRAGIDG